MRLFHASFDVALDVGAAAFSHPATRAGTISARAATDLQPMMSYAAILAATYDFSDPRELEHATFAAHHRVAYRGLFFRFGEWTKDSDCRHFGLHESRYFQFDVREIALRESELDIEIGEYLDRLLPNKQLQAIAGHLISEGNGSAWATHKDDLCKMAREDPVTAKYVLSGHLGLAEKRALDGDFRETVVRHGIVWAVADLVRCGRHMAALENAGRAAIGFANMATPQLVPAGAPREAVQLRAVMTAGEQFAGPLLALGKTQWDLHEQRARGIQPSRRRLKLSKPYSEDMPDHAWGHLLNGVHNYVVKSPELAKLLHLENMIGDRPRHALARCLPDMHNYIETSRARRRATQSQSARKPLPARMTLVEHHLLGFDRNEALWLVAAQAQEAIALLKQNLQELSLGRHCTVMRRVENVAFDQHVSLDCPALQMVVEIVRHDIMGDTKIAGYDWWCDDLDDPELYARATIEQRKARALKAMKQTVRGKVANLLGRRRLRPAQRNALDNLSLSFRHRC
jgi:hypothetical protein